MSRVAINGMGRIGRATLKIVLEEPHLELVAVNDLLPVDSIAYLLKYDSVYGRYAKPVVAQEEELRIGDERVRVLGEEDPAHLPWKDLDVDLVFECTGVFRRRPGMAKHLSAGARRVILSAPEKSGEVPMVVHGVSQPEGDPEMISCASCTTNCIAPVAEVLQRRVGIQKALMTTIHAYTSSQTIVDGPRRKWRRGRAGAINFVPTSTGAAKATTRVLPELAERFDGVAVRGPTPVGSLADMVFLTRQPVKEDAINEIFREEAQSERYRGILGVTDDPIVSSDIIQDDRASVVDLTLTQVVDGDLLKLMSWYDNEWGYSAQMVREAVRMTR
ncbi:MAG: type I glyceraldehyde-3-phosphate dehydrogenase [Candidatus Eisenbacteria bacterium]|nr:type I glyceraldehyde-3-phosphate dehydrogenase [Candidatus Eisenbacteria bacterium]